MSAWRLESDDFRSGIGRSRNGRFRVPICSFEHIFCRVSTLRRSSRRDTSTSDEGPYRGLLDGQTATRAPQSKAGFVCECSLARAIAKSSQPGHCAVNTATRASHWIGAWKPCGREERHVHPMSQDNAARTPERVPQNIASQRSPLPHNQRYSSIPGRSRDCSDVYGVGAGCRSLTTAAASALPAPAASRYSIAQDNREQGAKDHRHPPPACRNNPAQKRARQHEPARRMPAHHASLRRDGCALGGSRRGNSQDRRLRSRGRYVHFIVAAETQRGWIHGIGGRGRQSRTQRHRSRKPAGRSNGDRGSIP